MYQSYILSLKLIDERRILYAQRDCAYRVWGLRLTEIKNKPSCTFENRMCNLWQESKLRRKLTFWVTCQPASAQWQFERRKTKEVETEYFRPVKMKGHIRRPLLKNNLMHRTVFSIQTESRQERSQSWKRFADEERGFRLTMSFQKFVPTKQSSERMSDGEQRKNVLIFELFSSRKR